MTLQDGIFQCPVCDGPMTPQDYEAYHTCIECYDYAMTLCGEYQRAVERMEDEGGPVSGKPLDLED